MLIRTNFYPASYNSTMHLPKTIAYYMPKKSWPILCSSWWCSVVPGKDSPRCSGPGCLRLRQCQRVSGQPASRTGVRPGPTNQQRSCSPRPWILRHYCIKSSHLYFLCKFRYRVKPALLTQWVRSPCIYLPEAIDKICKDTGVDVGSSTQNIPIPASKTNIVW